jgi:dihydroorotase
MANKVDLVIKNGTVYTAEGSFKAGIAADNEKIVMIADEKQLPQAHRTIDAEGKIIIPGLIDIHTHVRDLQVAHKEDYEHASKAAAAGGFTMHIDMPNVRPATTTVETFLDKKKNYAEGHCTVDFNMFPSASKVEEIPKLYNLGILGYKIFQIIDTKRDYPHMPEIGIRDLGHLLDIFKAVAKTKLPVTVHPHSSELTDYIEKEIWQELGYGPLAYWEAGIKYNGINNTIGVSNCIHLAKVTGVRLNITHMRHKESVEIVRHAKANGMTNLTCDTQPHILFITRETVEKIGPLALGSGNTPENQEAVWKALNDGTIDLISTEHAPHSQEEKKIGWENMWKAPGGPGSNLQELLPLFLTQINKGKLPLETFIRCTSLKPAKLYGIYPKKGVIQIGSDADLTIIDMNKKDVLRNEKCYSKCGYSSYDGTEVQGVPIYTICRGTVVMEDGEITVKPGYGKFQPRLGWKETQ